jgi:hypothetical protein
VLVGRLAGLGGRERGENIRVILIAVGLASGSSTAWIELWWGLGIVKRRVETQREAPIVLVGGLAGFGLEGKGRRWR